MFLHLGQAFARIITAHLSFTSAAACALTAVLDPSSHLLPFWSLDTIEANMPWPHAAAHPSVSSMLSDRFDIFVRVDRRCCVRLVKVFRNPVP